MKISKKNKKNRLKFKFYEYITYFFCPIGSMKKKRKKIDKNLELISR